MAIESFRKHRRFFSLKICAVILIITLSAGPLPQAAAESGTLVLLSDGNLALGARALVSSVYGNDDRYSGVNLTDGNASHDSRWAAGGNQDCYTVIELGRTATLNRVKLYEDTVYGERISDYTVQYWDGTGWKTTANNHTQSAAYTDDENRSYRLLDASFTAVSTNKLRIGFSSSVTDGPAVREIEVLNETGKDVVTSRITVDGKTLDGFSPTRFHYDIVLPAGSRVPAVASATGTVTPAAEIPGSAAVSVKSGNLENTYTLNFWEDTGHMVNEIFDAHKFSEKSGVTQDELAPDGSSVGNFEAKGYLKYHSIDFGAGEAKVLMAVASSAVNGRLELRIDGVEGELIGTLGINATGSALIFNEQYAGIRKVVGVHDLYIISNTELPVHLDTIILSSYGGTETKEEKDERMAWWREARYGQFIHFGAYANFPFQSAEEFNGYSEWVMDNWKLSRTAYENLAVSTFNPTEFDAGSIVQNASGAGARYMVFTSKHHEGYSMFDTQIRNFKNYSLLGYGLYDGEDPVMELSKECREAGIKFGCYYSIMDWHHFAQGPFGNTVTDKAAYVADMKAQLRELIQKYDVEILWFDGEWKDWWTTADGDALYRYLRTLKPSLIINNRVGKRAQTDGDFGTPEQEIPAAGLDTDFESCITMNNSWGYLKYDTDWKSVQWIISSLADTASKGGNMLLNVGPDPTGVVPEECTDRLDRAGEWLKQYGESIYGTTASPFSSALTFGSATKREGKLYLHVINWPENGRLLVPAVKNKIRSVSLMGQSGKLAYGAGDGYILIQLPESPVNEYDSVVVVELDGTPMQSEDSYLSHNLAKNMPAAASNYYSNNPEYDASKAVDGDSATRWATDDHSSSATLEIDFGRPTEFNMAVCDECITWGPRIGRFQIEYWDGSAWQIAAASESMGAGKVLAFDTVSSSKMRLRILSLLNGSTSGPTVSEVQVYNIAPTAMILEGDVNLDREVTAADVVALRKIIADGNPTAQQLEAGDLDHDGVLSFEDTRLLLESLDITPGDVDGSGTAGALDIMLIRKALLSDTATDAQLAAGDLDEDGRLKPLDIMLLRKLLLKQD